MKPHFSKTGMPTEPEVKKLIEAFQDLNEGDVIPHSKIAEVLEREMKTTRYKIVVEAWRKQLFHGGNVWLKAIPGEGYQVADPSARIESGVRKQKTALTYHRKAWQIVSTTDRARLTTEERQIQDHIIKNSSVYLGVAVTSPKKIAFPTPE